MLTKHSFFVVFITLLAIVILLINTHDFEEEPVIIEELTLPNNTVYARVPAIDTNGEGILLDLFVKVDSGSGRVFTDIENLIFWTDTQESIKTAKLVAEKITNISTDNVDLTYTLRARDNTTIVGGGSAGAILTIATVAALTERTIDSSIIISGGISENGTILPVGGISGKVSIAKENGIEVFLLPENTVSVEILTPKKDCIWSDNFEICELAYTKTKTIPIQKELNITIIEVSNISEVLYYYNL